MGNAVANTVTSIISGGSTVMAGGDISLLASDKSPSMIPLLDAIGSLIPDDNPDPEDGNRTSRDKLEEALDGSPIDPSANILALMVSVAGTGGVAVNVARQLQGRRSAARAVCGLCVMRRWLASVRTARR